MALKKSVTLSSDNMSNPTADSGVDAATQMAGDPGNDFAQGSLTPDQQAEQDTLDGHNAALRAINGAVPEINKLNHSVFKLKSDMSFREFLKLSPEEQKAQFVAAQEELKTRKRKVNSQSSDDASTQDQSQGL